MPVFEIFLFFLFGFALDELEEIFAVPEKEGVGEAGPFS